MITINLLPEEFKQSSRTPVKFMMAVLVAVTVNASLIAWFSWKAIGEAAEVGSELSVLQDTMSSLEPQIAYHKALEAENQAYQSREETLEQIQQNRISWTKKLDQLIDVINDGGEQDEYLIWLSDLTVAQSADARKKNYGSLKAAGNSGSGSFTHVANFLEDIEADEFSYDFLPPAPPEGSQSKVDEDLIPSQVISFPLDMALRAPKDRGTPTSQLSAEAKKGTSK